MKQRISAPPEVGRPEGARRGGHWVQTERATHELWARFTMKKPAAGAALHVLVAKIGQNNAVVISQKVLAELVGVTDRTIRTAIADLEAGNWIQVVRIGKGREAAYVVNDRVVWGESRDKLPFSIFSATIVADARDQEPATIDGPKLRTIPVLFRSEQQLPTGPGEDPPSQPGLPGVDLPNLPEIRGDQAVREQLEARGQGRLIDQETGEILS